jgi:hypothetical protein
MNNKRYWLRGAVIVGTLGIILIALNYFAENYNWQISQPLMSYLAYSIFPVYLVGFTLVALPGMSVVIANIILLIVSIIWVLVYALVGGTLGYLYGKIKNRSKSI